MKDWEKKYHHNYVMTHAGSSCVKLKVNDQQSLPAMHFVGESVIYEQICNTLFEKSDGS